MKNKTFVFESDKPEVYELDKKSKIIVVTNYKTFNDFFKVPWKVYEKDKFWVPTLWKEISDEFKLKNIFWTHSETRLFVAYKNNTAVGRIAAIIDHKLKEPHGKKIGYFGYFECIEDYKIANELLKKVQEWLALKKVKIMRGPINLHIEQRCGFLLEGFESSPFLLSSYSPKYYLKIAKSFNFKKSTDLVSYLIDLTKPFPKSFINNAQKCIDEGLSFRKVSRLKLTKELPLIFDLVIDTFKEHWGFVPVSYQEFLGKFGIQDIKWVIKPNLFLIAEKDDQPIGVKWAMPNYNHVFKKLNGKFGVLGVFKFLWHSKNIHKGKFVITGIKKKYRGQGIASCLNYYVLYEMKKMGYNEAEYGWIEENNISSRKIPEKLGGKLYKKYRVFEKVI